MNSKAIWLHLTIAATLLLVPVTSQAYYVRIKDLNHLPQPPNPVTFGGTVKSTSPLTVSDGSGKLIVIGLERLEVGDFVVITGDHNDGSVVAQKATGWLGPARMEMIWAPTSTFMMGNTGTGDDAGPWAQQDESPRHSVTLSGYWIGKFEVTRAQFRRFIEAGGYSNTPYWSQEGWDFRSSFPWNQPALWAPEQNWSGTVFEQTDRHPVAGVIWYEAEAFCSWARLRLPTEAEWERAARWDGSCAYIYPWGDTADPEKANGYEDSSPAGGGEHACQTAPVGSYLGDTSPIGCMDMAGNLREMVADRYAADYYSQMPAEGCVDPTGPDSGFERVMRGGSWECPTVGMRCAARSSLPVPYGYWYDYGFRAAR